MTTTYKRVLFVGPDDQSLKIIPELDALYDLGYEVRTLQSNVTDDRLFDAVRLQHYDIIHFAAHGNHDSTQLTTSPLTYNGIQQVVRQCGAKIVFLNECGSASIAQRLVNSGLPVSVGTFVDVDDSIAKQTSMAFYQELARSNDPHAAYLFACSGEYYGYFSNGAYAQLLTENINNNINMLRLDLNRTRVWTYSLIGATFIIMLFMNIVQHHWV